VKSDFGVFIADSPTAHSNAGPLTGWENTRENAVFGRK
jgi:hypothetical protein